MNAELQKKVDRAIRLIQAAATRAAAIGQPLEVCYSGGKDSDVILELAKMAKVNYRAIYKNTTIDPPGTISHVLKNGVEVKRPKESFLQLMRRKGWPSRKVRFCCDELKEYKILDYAILGIRKEESRKRDEIYKEPEICREYCATSKVSQTLPILYWTECDVLDFIQERHITCAPHYYDSDGAFHPERRLGCMCCPLMSKKKRIVEFQRHPNMVKLYLRGGAILSRPSQNGEKPQALPQYLRVVRVLPLLRKHRRVQRAVRS